ncbi:hypothetical protein FRC00_006313 [Tulasnella sp. 408]|nr:hypothetical protein FRC00_006313 [Tulasnella sp. 408]
MAGDKEPFMGPLGRPCTIYVERDGTFEGVALGQEQTIKAVGGIVTKEADEAAVVVVIERTEAIEQRICDTYNYRTTDPVTQAVVDWGWIYDCIKKSELQGPPNWGGHLLRPKEQEPAITRDKAKEAAFAIFGHLQDVEHEAVAGEPDAMQLDPAPPAGRPGTTSGDDTQEEEPRGRQMIGSNNQEPGREGEKSPKDIAWKEVKRLIEEAKQKRGFRTFSSDDMQILIDELYQIESSMEPAEGWWEAFTARRAAVTPEAQVSAWQHFETILPRQPLVTVIEAVQVDAAQTEVP